MLRRRALPRKKLTHFRRQKLRGQLVFTGQGGPFSCDRAAPSSDRARPTGKLYATVRI
jgi:hypothetical protein